MIAKRLAALAAVATLALAACSSDPSASSSAPAPTDSNCAAAENLCIGLVTDTGKVDDKSFNQSAWEGAVAAADELGGFAKYIETVDSKDYASNMQQFIDRDYDVIVTVGFLMAEATVEAANANPDIVFIGVDQDQSAGTVPNLTGLVFPEDQAGYAAGFLAAKISTTGKLGQVLGLEIPPVQKFALGFEAGAKAANPAVEVTTVYHPFEGDGFNDPEWGANEASKQLGQGIDVIFGAGGNTGNGALREIAKAEGAGTSIFCIGVDADQWNTVPEAQPCLVTSAMKLITLGVTDLIKAANDGSIEGGNFFGQTGLADYHDFASVIDQAVQDEVAAIVAGLKDGSIQTGVSLG
ncbi:MAG: hypothetical protein RL038_1232 [Actinomycetota bacterium]